MNEFLAGILKGINSVVQNYGWSMIIFTLFIKLIILPLDYKSRKSMRRMTKLQPEMTRLQKKYANDKEKLNQKTAELYRKEGVSPMSGCLPMLVSMAILWIMFDAMRLVANTELANQAVELLTTGTQHNEGWLWIKNIWMPDSPFNSTFANSNVLKMIPANIWSKVYTGFSGNADVIAKLSEFGIDAATISGDSIFAALQTLPVYVEETALSPVLPYVNLLITRVNIYLNNNGLFILPVLAALTQYFMTVTQSKDQPAPAEGQQAGTGAFMKYFFPLFSLWICSSYNAIFSLYWVVGNLFAWAETVILNRIFEKNDKNQQNKPEGDGLK